MNPKLLLCLALVLGGGLFGCSTTSSLAAPDHASSINTWQTSIIASEADLYKVITQLQNPTTRFDAFQALLEFAGYPRGNTSSGDLNVDALHEKAVSAIQTCPDLDTVIATMINCLKEPNQRLPMLRGLLWFSGGFGGMQGFAPSSPLEKTMDTAKNAVNKAMDVPTVKRALLDSDWLLRITAVEHFGNPLAETNEWKPLLPQMEKLAVDDDSAIRSAADGKLRGFPGTEKFLDERLTNETSAEVILELLRDRNVGNELNDRFLALFVPLLSNPDEKVREDALWFVSFNSNRAPVLQFSFGMDVYDRVVASTHAKSAKERAAAASALTDIRKLDADRSRKIFLQLVSDPDPDVRQLVPFGLAGQFDRGDVKQAAAVLLKDKSPSVRFMTILAFGSQNYIPELEALSKGTDPLIANLASNDLKQLYLTNGTNRYAPAAGQIDSELSIKHANMNGAAGTNSLRVVVIPSKTEVHVKEPFEVALRVENPTNTNQTVRVMSCSWDEEWQSSNTNISLMPWICQKNFPVNVEIPPGGAYTNEAAMCIYNLIPANEISFRMGFTPINSDKTFWSDSVVIDVDPDLTKQISDILVECEKIKPGRTRAELLKAFTTEGGLYTATHRTYVYRGCPYIKIDVDFIPSDPKKNVSKEQLTDTIVKVSKPYLEWSIFD